LQPLAALKNIEIALTKPEFQGVTPTGPGPQFFEKPAEALRSMAQKATAKDLIVITGSLYLCGDYLKGI
jgi:folylpolyglutamate synthase/dihydropteroate synthase